MWDYEAMKEAGLDLWTIRDCAVNHHELVLNQLDRMIGDMQDGKFQKGTPFSLNAKLLMLRLIDEVFKSGVEVGFTYSVPEFQSYLELRDED